MSMINSTVQLRSHEGWPRKGCRAQISFLLIETQTPGTVKQSQGSITLFVSGKRFLSKPFNSEYDSSLIQLYASLKIS